MLCGVATLTLDAANNSAIDYLWQDGSTNSTFEVTTSGVYFVKVSNHCESDTDTINIQVFNEPLFVDLGVDTVLCDNVTLTLDATNNGSATYQWQDGTTTPTYFVTQAGIYTVTVSNLCESVQDEIAIIVTGNPPGLDITESVNFCINESIEIDATTFDANTYEWQNGTTNPILTVTSEGLYFVSATNNCGTSVDSIFVNAIDCNCYVSVPNAFSPNEDGRNDVFQPMIDGVCNFMNYRFLIFNRWGQLIFETINTADNWDGFYHSKRQPQDSYVWIVEYELDNGFTEVLKGAVLLVR